MCRRLRAGRCAAGSRAHSKGISDRASWHTLISHVRWSVSKAPLYLMLLCVCCTGTCLPLKSRGWDADAVEQRMQVPVDFSIGAAQAVNCARSAVTAPTQHKPQTSLQALAAAGSHAANVAKVKRQRCTTSADTSAQGFSQPASKFSRASSWRACPLGCLPGAASGDFAVPRYGGARSKPGASVVAADADTAQASHEAACSHGRAAHAPHHAVQLDGKTAAGTAQAADANGCAASDCEHDAVRISPTVLPELALQDALVLAAAMVAGEHQRHGAASSDTQAMVPPQQTPVADRAPASLAEIMTRAHGGQEDGETRAWRLWSDSAIKQVASM